MWGGSVRPAAFVFGLVGVPLGGGPARAELLGFEDLPLGGPHGPLPIGRIGGGTAADFGVYRGFAFDPNFSHLGADITSVTEGSRPAMPGSAVDLMIGAGLVSIVEAPPNGAGAGRQFGFGGGRFAPRVVTPQFNGQTLDYTARSIAFQGSRDGATAAATTFTLDPAAANPAYTQSVPPAASGDIDALRLLPAFADQSGRRQLLPRQPHPRHGRPRAGNGGAARGRRGGPADVPHAPP